MRTKMFVNAIPSPTKEQPSTIVFRGRTRYQTPISTSGNDMQMTDVIVDVPIQSRVLHSEHRWRRIELPTFHGSTIALHTGQRSRNWLMTYFRPSNCRRGAIGEEYGFTSAMIQCTNVIRLTRKAPRSRLQSETTSPGALSVSKRLLGIEGRTRVVGEYPHQLRTSAGRRAWRLRLMRL